MLKVLCYIEDKEVFQFIAVSDSGRLATRVQNPFAAIPEIQDLEHVLREKLDSTDQKPDGLEELIEAVHRYNEGCAVYERIRHVKTLTPQLAHAINFASMSCDARSAQQTAQSRNTIIDMKLEEIKEDGK